ncbi:hypothetical protein [Deinococcus yavapaiensis]|uniref:Uncharacterized protein n=1 Tax=Deinococcus yavapaiensis KR-236 TaxID=694435 RepID=A0A318S5C8_9DEIO|nr:hypothetical protein [Deinococcus yavapaiensis]PYE53314.1 hypothetical protein DES52_10987 [Deinococcus yavapaiensis KR-236]
MKHLVFPNKTQADAFVQDLLAQGVIQPETRSANFGRRSTMRDANLDAQADASTRVDTTRDDVMAANDADAGAEDAGAGAVKGTGVGAVVGAVAAAVGTVATGGALAIPVLLGMTALGSGVGASVGAVGGAGGVDENHDGRTSADSYGATGTPNVDSSDHVYHLDDERFDSLYTSTQQGTAIAVEDDIPSQVVEAAAARHGGRFV